MASAEASHRQQTRIIDKSNTTAQPMVSDRMPGQLLSAAGSQYTAPIMGAMLNRVHREAAGAITCCRISTSGGALLYWIALLTKRSSGLCRCRMMLEAA